MNPDDFLIDSAATAHVCNTRDYFQDLQPASGSKILTGAGTLPVLGMGTVYVVDDYNQSYEMQNVLFAPDFPVNLFSSTVFNSEGGTLKTTASHATLESPDGVLLTTTRSFKGIYVLQQTRITVAMAAVHTSAKPITYWHNALGHVGYTTLMKMIKQCSVLGMNVVESTTRVAHQCLSCIKGKFKRDNFPIKEMPHEPLEHLHTDLSGPHPEGLNKHKYVCIVRDKFSGYTMTRTIQEKSEAAPFIKYAINWLERNSEYKVKQLRSDGGGEFIDHSLKSWLEEKGIHHGVTAPESSASNGAAERVIMTLFERVRAVLVESNQPRLLWPYIVGHITHGMNHVPYGEHTKSPIEILFKKKPDVSTLVPFGAAVVSWVPTQGRTDKLEPRGAEGRIVGYHPESSSMYQVTIMYLFILMMQSSVNMCKI